MYAVFNNPPGPETLTWLPFLHPWPTASNNVMSQIAITGKHNYTCGFYQHPPHTSHTHTQYTPHNTHHITHAHTIHTTQHPPHHTYTHNPHHTTPTTSHMHTQYTPHTHRRWKHFSFGEAKGALYFLVEAIKQLIIHVKRF